MTHTLAQIYGFEGTTAETIFIVGFSGLMLLSVLTLKINLRLLIIAGILFATALTAPVDLGKLDYVRTWILPLQQRRSEVHLALGCVLTALTLFRRDLHAHDLNFQGLMCLIIALFMATLQFYHEGTNVAVQTLGFFLGTIPCLLLAVPTLTRDYAGILQALRTVLYVSALWTFCCSVQFVINPQALVNRSGRFWGLFANAQQAAIFCAPMAIIALWMFLGDPRRRNRVVWLALLTINLLFLMWTGSRTGALMFALGLLPVMWTRAGKLLLFLPAGLVVFYLLSLLADYLQIGRNVERLISTEDTRLWAFEVQINSFLESPLLGVGWYDVGASENSYFGGLGAYGIGFGVLVAVLLFGSMFLCAKLLIARRSLPADQRPLVDLFCGFNAMYFGGAFFEGYLTARSSATLTMMLIFAPIGAYLLRLAADPHAHEAPEYGEEDDAAPQPSTDAAPAPGGGGGAHAPA